MSTEWVACPAPGIMHNGAHVTHIPPTMRGTELQTFDAMRAAGIMCPVCGGNGQIPKPTPWDRIGHRAPVDAGDIIDVIDDTIDDDGMIFELHESGIVGAYHDDVGLVTYYRFPDVDAARVAIATRNGGAR